MSQWLLCDLHIHTTLSDGEVPIEDVVRLYGEAKFDAIAITDHLFDTQTPRSLEIHEEGKSVEDVAAYFQKIDEIAHWAKETFDLLIIPGLEICNLTEDFHILGLDLKEAIHPNQDAEHVIDAIHRQGGLAIASHPPLKLSYFLNEDRQSINRHPLHLWKYKERYVDKIDAWEIANQEDLLGEVGLERLPYVANSDFHKRHHIHSWKSMIFAKKDKEDIKKSILDKKVALFFYNDGKNQREVPWRKKKQENQTPQEDEMKTTEGMKILIIDDEKDLVELISYHLENKGFKTLKAYDGYEGWVKIESEKPDLLILDLMMPNLDGWELCRLVRHSQQKDIRETGILMLTARVLPEDRVYGLELGADDYLTKPFSVRELLLRVARLAEKRKTISQLEDEVKSLQVSMETKESNIRKMAHDLKSPLISIGYSARRMLRKQPNEETTSALQTIFDSSLQLTQWIDETLGLPPIDPATFQEQIRAVEMDSLFTKAINLLKENALEKDIEIRLKVSHTIPKIFCHESMIFRALVNLLSNALKYTPKGGRVDISVIAYLNKRGSGVLEITLKDNGIGICEEDLEKIFQPYYRGKNNPFEEGKGLGLSLVKEVVDLHGGKILVQSEPNIGSIFSILLPIKDVPQEGFEKATPERVEKTLSLSNRES